MNVNININAKIKAITGLAFTLSVAATMVAADIAALGSTARGGTS